MESLRAGIYLNLPEDPSGAHALEFRAGGRYPGGHQPGRSWASQPGRVEGREGEKRTAAV